MIFSLFGEATRKEIPKQLQPRYIGSFVINRRISETTYEVQDLACNRTMDRMFVFPAHTCQLKPLRLPLSEGNFPHIQEEIYEETNENDERGEEGEGEENEGGTFDPEEDVGSNNEDVASSPDTGRPQHHRRLPFALLDLVIGLPNRRCCPGG